MLSLQIISSCVEKQKADPQYMQTVKLPAAEGKEISKFVESKSKEN